MDTRLYLDINNFAVRTPWAHAVMREYALYGGVALLALLVLWTWWRARGGLLGGGDREQVAAVAWTGLAALALNQPLAHLVGRRRPYDVLRGVEVLVPRANDFTCPSDHAVVAGAVIAGLWWVRDRLTASLATIFGLLLAFSRVYVGAHYPGDVLAGLAFGAAVLLVGAAGAMPLLRRLVDVLAGSPLRALVGAEHHRRPAGPGPAARPTPVESSGAVRILGPVVPGGTPGKGPRPRSAGPPPRGGHPGPLREDPEVVRRIGSRPPA